MPWARNTINIKHKFKLFNIHWFTLMESYWADTTRNVLPYFDNDRGWRTNIRRVEYNLWLQGHYNIVVQIKTIVKYLKSKCKLMWINLVQLTPRKIRKVNQRKKIIEGTNRKINNMVALSPNIAIITLSTNSLKL